MIESNGVEVSTSGLSAFFDGMTWPTAGVKMGDAEYTLRHGSYRASRPLVLTAASVLAAYRELVNCPRTKREAVVRRLREAERIAQWEKRFLDAAGLDTRGAD